MTIQERLNSCSGSTVELGPSTFEFSPPEAVDPIQATPAALTLRNQHDVRIVGYGAKLKFRTHGHGLCIQNCYNVLIEGITFEGAGQLHAENSFYYALALLHGQNSRITFRNCRFLLGGNHGVAHLWGPRTSNFCTVDSCYFADGGNFNRTYLGGDGAAIAIGGYGGMFINNRIDNWLRGIEIEAHDEPVDCANNIISGNTLRGCTWQSILITPTGGQWRAFHHINVINNLIQGTGVRTTKFSNTGIYISGGDRIIVANNSIYDIADGIGILASTDHGEINDLLLHSNMVDAQRVRVLVTTGATQKDPRLLPA